MTRVAVVGCGNAALCAAIRARECGADVDVYEAAPRHLRGGNTRFAGGGFRTVYNGAHDLREIVPELTEQEITETDFGSYSFEQYMDDLGRLSGFRTDPDLAHKLVSESWATLLWLKSHGIRFMPLYRRQSYEVSGRRTFWGGLTIEAYGGGDGLVTAEIEAAERMGVRFHYSSRVRRLVTTDSEGVTAIGLPDRLVRADAVVLACGGFEANASWRARYLGPGWDLATVRGTRFNVGDGIQMAIDAGAATCGNWSGCHSVAWDANAPPFGDLQVGDSFQKHSYPLGILVNRNGRRFVDEGADFRNYTYARYGGEILRQPGQIAWQIFDGSVLHLLRDEYRIQKVSKVTADSVEELAERLADVDSVGLIRTIADFNESIDTSVAFDPAVKDQRKTRGLEVPKSNWAVPLTSPPFEAYAVGCGITFTFGGLQVDQDARVLDTGGAPVPGCFAAGEIVGGLYYFNYPGGAGLMSGSVFGYAAGESAANYRPNVSTG